MNFRRFPFWRIAPFARQSMAGKATGEAPSSLIRYLTGGVSSMVAVVASNPIEVVKTRWREIYSLGLDCWLTSR